MKKISLIDKTSELYGQETLKSYYDSKIIPPEKKEYIADLKNSVGPYMGIETNSKESHYMMDAASQIATLGLGFNSLPFFAPAFHSDSFTNDPLNKNFKNTRKSFEDFFKRKLEWDNLATTFCHSGAEANEIALGYCFRRRVNKDAKKILAFEGSFHGRMQISLSSTWNKAKRAPFEWSNFLTEFISFPNTKSANQKRKISNEWLINWENAPSKSFSPDICPSETYDNNEWHLEKKSLLEAKNKLEQGDIFAIIIEPMQCEGGDQYATSRFFQGLVSLSRSYDVPIIFDEVQTGYHLGDDFFWHKQFDLKNSKKKLLTPDYLVCAKKAQIGLVISHCDEKKTEEFSAASFYRGYAHAISLDNAKIKIQNIKTQSLEQLNTLVEKYEDFIERPRGLGLCFAFDLKDKKHVTEIIKKRFDYGLLYYPAGEKTLRFRLNTGFKSEDIKFLFHQLDCLLSENFLGEKIKTLSPPRDIQKVAKDNKRTYEWINFIFQLKNNNAPDTNTKSTIELIKNILQLDSNEDLVCIDGKNINKYIERIQKLQKEVYETSRQTSNEIFINCASSEGSICFVIEKDEEIVAMSFSAPASNFSDEKGLSDHDDLLNPKCIYTTDTTISPGEAGKKRGRDLKFATVASGLSQGKNIFIGRNRYQVASSMMDINLALGGYIYKFSKNDYNDNIRPNDVIHYKIDLSNGCESTNLSSQLNSLGDASSFIPLDDPLSNEKLASINNKICLSNFVGTTFLKNIDYILKLAPEELRHGYTTSGQSECVDKIVKSIWFKNKKGQTLISFEGHHFGHGSFLSRSISGMDDDFFKRKILPHPTKENIDNIIESIVKLSKENNALGVFLEPLGQKTGEKIDVETLGKLRKVTTEVSVPLIFNETGSKFYAYSNSSFYASSNSLKPDAIMTYHGGQLATVNLTKEFFLDKPLMLISTWDGDEFSSNLAFQEISQLESNKKEFFNLKEKLNTELNHFLTNRDVKNYSLNSGVGFFEFPLGPELSSVFTRLGQRTIVNPSFNALKKYYKSN